MENNEPVVLAVNHYTMTLENQYLAFRTMRRWTYILLWSVLLVFFVFMDIGLIVTIANDSERTSVLYFGVSLFVLLTLLYVYLLPREILIWRRLAKKNFETAQELTGSAAPECKTLFYEDQLCAQFDADESGMKKDYSAVTRITEYPDCFVLETKYQYPLYVDKQGFSEIDVPGFRDMILQKCPNARKKQKSANK